jgi:hypothetical protein
MLRTAENPADSLPASPCEEAAVAEASEARVAQPKASRESQPHPTTPHADAAAGAPGEVPLALVR